MPADSRPGAVDWLDEVWCASVTDLCPAPDAVTGQADTPRRTVQLIVTGPPKSGLEDAILLDVVRGRVVRCCLARDPAADVSFTLSVDTFEDLLRGSLEIPVAYMQGRCKAAGDAAVLFDLLALLAGDHGRDWIARVGSIRPSD